MLYPSMQGVPPDMANTFGNIVNNLNTQMNNDQDLINQMNTDLERSSAMLD